MGPTAIPRSKEAFAIPRLDLEGEADLHQLPGERQNLPRTRSGVRPSPAETGERSAGQPPSGFSEVGNRSNRDHELPSSSDSSRKFVTVFLARCNEVCGDAFQVEHGLLVRRAGRAILTPPAGVPAPDLEF